jgi:hypothetical protein
LNTKVTKSEGVAGRGFTADFTLAVFAPLSAGWLEIGHVSLKFSREGMV